MEKNYNQVIIFDFDGVLIDSKKNMEISWNKTKKKFFLNYKFNKYFKFIGKPFKDILISLGVKKDFSEIEKNFKIESQKNFGKIKLYKDVIKTLNYLKRKKIIIGIFTSKDKDRTQKLVKKFKLKVNFIQCPQKGYKGKPSPDLLNKIIKKNNFQKSKCTYVGDAKVDLISAKKAKINFVLAKYGYKVGIKKYKNSINSISKIKKIIE